MRLVACITLSRKLDYFDPLTRSSAGTKLGSNKFLTVVRDPTEFNKVYGTVPGAVLGPYAGQLTNGGAKVDRVPVYILRSLGCYCRF